ncbi:high frequency lysogenization protein HflD [Marilutibacter maris]|uniref:High frequency lysogenization protein HflD homolog n=1 Tax=Marilutibacter maris TaxID=1605891 RepID=A0A2U9TGF4_9GAMM|nr:high frequency lysogenization protein HflD [Lysobacter maris]AWV07250.1 lysogenization protein HflD [Lysobacter maris]KAB8189499.1 high frequency lysogenization protein HflD [Lysobacter maris]
MTDSSNDHSNHAPADRTIADRALALAGLLQALGQVRRIAETGQANVEVLATSLDSVFRIDAASPAEVYGGTAALRPGLTLLREYFTSRLKDEQLPRLALAVIQLERRFVADPAMAQRVRDGITAQQGAAEHQGSTHPEVMTALGDLYAETLSHLRPRVLVQGNPHYLGQSAVVAEVRAALLAAVRSAVLWRQLGGSLFDLLLRRRQLVNAVEQLLR